MAILLDDNPRGPKRRTTTNSIAPMKKTVHDIHTGVRSKPQQNFMGSIFTSTVGQQHLARKNLIVSERLSDKTIKKYRCGTMRVVNFCIDI